MSRAPSFAAALRETLQAAVGAALGGGDPPRQAELFGLLKQQLFQESLSLLEQHPQLWAARDEGGKSPLHWAALGGCVDFVRSAVAAGVPLDVQAPDGQTPLMWAVCGGDLVMVAALLDARADMLVRDSNRATLFIIAIQQGRHGVAQLLASRGREEMLTGCDRSGCTAVHWAAHLGDVEALSLLESLQAELRALDAGGASPLHRAVAAGRLDAVGFLLDRDLDPALRSGSGRSCLDMAAEGPDRRLQGAFLRSAFKRSSKQRGAGACLASPSSARGAGDAATGPLSIAAWAPMTAGVAACWAGSGTAPPGERKASCAGGEGATTFELDRCSSSDDLLQALAARLPDSSEAAVCLWVVDSAGRPIDLHSLQDSALSLDRFPAQVRLLRVDPAGFPGAVRGTSELHSALARRMRASPGRFEGRVLTPVPPELRWEVWKDMLQLHACHLPSSNGYRELSRCENEWTELVKADAHRTFKGYDEEQRQCLMRVLNAYAAHDAGVGYCQGMNRIAGLLLLLSGCEREEECFCALVGLMDRLGLAGFFQEGFPLLNRYVDACNELLEERAPELLRHLSREGVEPDMYLRQWLLTLFIDCLPLPLVVSVWDAIIRYGLSFALRVAVALLDSMKETLLGLHSPALTEALKALRDNSARGEDRLWLGQLLVDYAGAVPLPENVLVQ